MKKHPVRGQSKKNVRFSDGDPRWRYRIAFARHDPARTFLYSRSRALRSAPLCARLCARKPLYFSRRRCAYRRQIARQKRTCLRCSFRTRDDLASRDDRVYPFFKNTDASVYGLCARAFAYGSRCGDQRRFGESAKGT